MSAEKASDYILEMVKQIAALDIAVIAALVAFAASEDKSACSLWVAISAFSISLLSVVWAMGRATYQVIGGNFDGVPEKVQLPTLLSLLGFIVGLIAGLRFIFTTL